MKVRGETSNEEDGEKVRKRRGQGERNGNQKILRGCWRG